MTANPGLPACGSVPLRVKNFRYVWRQHGWLQDERRFGLELLHSLESSLGLLEDRWSLMLTGRGRSVMFATKSAARAGSMSREDRTP